MVAGGAGHHNLITGGCQHLSSHMRKQEFGLYADQLCSNCEADQCLCFCYVDSTVPCLPKPEISSISSCAVRFASDKVGNQKKKGFSHVTAHLKQDMRKPVWGFRSALTQTGMYRGRLGA